MRKSHNMYRKQLLLQIIHLAAMQNKKSIPIQRQCNEAEYDSASWLHIYNKETGSRNPLISESFKTNFLNVFITNLN